MFRRDDSRTAPIAAAILLFGAVLISAAGASEVGPDPMADGLSPRERLDALIERVKLEQAATKTLHANFVQDKTSELLLEPSQSRGSFVYQSPDRALWRYDEPRPMTTLIKEEEMVTWYQDLNQVRKVKVARYSEQVLKYLGASGSLETLMKYFSVTADFPEADGDPYVLRLHPRYARIKKRLESMEIRVSPDTFLPVFLNYVETGGDTTTYRFSETSRNEPVAEEVFALEFPADADVREVKLGSG